MFESPRCVACDPCRARRDAYPFFALRPEREKQRHGWRAWNDLLDTGPDYFNRKE